MNRKRKKKKNKKNIGTNVVGRSITRTNQLAGLKINQIGFLARWYSQVYPRFSKKGFRKPVIHRGTNHSFNGLSLDAVIFLGKGIDRISTCLPVHQWESRPTFSRSEKIGSISKSSGVWFYRWGGSSMVGEEGRFGIFIGKVV